MSTESAAEKSAVNGIRTALGIGGVLSVIVGILILVWPGKTAMVVTAIIAIYAIAAGLVYAGLGIFSKTKGGWSRVGHIALGILFIIAGIVAFLNLGAATAWLAVVHRHPRRHPVDRRGRRRALDARRRRVEGLDDLLRDHQHHRRYLPALLADRRARRCSGGCSGIALIVLGIIQIVRAFTFGKKDL